MPGYDAQQLAAGVLTLIRDGMRLEQLATAGLRTAAEHSIEHERNAYHRILASYVVRDDVAGIPAPVGGRSLVGAG